MAKGEESTDTDGMCDELVVLKTPALNRFLCFLNELHLGEQPGTVIAVSQLKEINDVINPSDKALFHLILTSQIEHATFKDAFRNNSRREPFSSVLDIIDLKEDGNGLTSESYLEIVIGLGLVNEWLAMLVANPQASTFMLETARAMTDTIIQGEIELDAIFKTDLIVIFFRLCRLSDTNIRQEYFSCFKQLVSCGFQSSCMTESRKWLTIFRLLAVGMLLDSENYAGNNEINELLLEWQLNETLDMKSVRVYEELFNFPAWKGMGSNTRLDILHKLDEIIPGLNLKEKQSVSVNELNSTYKTMTISSYLGGSAYILSLVIANIGVDLSNFLNLSKIISDWMENKPKMTSSEFVAECDDFDSFCKTMKQHGKERNVYKDEWTSKFLTFPADSMFGTERGIELAKSFILSGKLEINFVLEYLRKLLEFEGKLSIGHKQSLLKVLINNSFTEEQNKLLVRQLFKNGTHNKLRLENFCLSLNTLLSQLTTIEFETNSANLEKHKLDVLMVCFQDPSVTLTQLLDQSMKLEHFKALGFAESFFQLDFPRSYEGDEEKLPKTVLINSFNYLLIRLPAFPDNIFEIISSGINFLTIKTWFNVKDIFAVLKCRMLKLLKGKTVPLGVVLGYVVLLEKFVLFLIENSKEVEYHYALIKNVADFVIRIKTFFEEYTNVSTYEEALSIRSHLNVIITSITKFNVSTCCLESITTLDLEEKSPHDIGTLYIRHKTLRPNIIKLIENDNLFEERDFQWLCQNIVRWAGNCCESDWPSLCKFVFDVVLKSNRRFKIGQFSKIFLLNDCLKSFYAISRSLTASAILSHGMKFHEFSIRCLEDLGEILEKEAEQVLETIFTVVIALSISATTNEKATTLTASKGLRKEAANSLFLVLTYFLNKLQYYTNKNMVNAGFRNSLLSKMALLPDTGSKCQPICWLIKKQLGGDSE